MTAIERLHKLLDERGVEYEDAYGITLWTGADGCAYTAIEMVPLSMKPSKKLMVRRTLTPEQAIAATLGPGTCGEWRNKCTYYDPTGVDAELWCEHCDEPLEVDWDFCPHCGARIEVDA